MVKVILTLKILQIFNYRPFYAHVTEWQKCIRHSLLALFKRENSGLDVHKYIVNESVHVW